MSALKTTSGQPALPGVRSRTTTPGAVRPGMGSVAVTVAFTALDAYLGRDLSGATGLVLSIGAFACIVGLSGAFRPTLDGRSHPGVLVPQAGAAPRVLATSGPTPRANPVAKTPCSTGTTNPRDAQASSRHHTTVPTRRTPHGSHDRDVGGRHHDPTVQGRASAAGVVVASGAQVSIAPWCRRVREMRGRSGGAFPKRAVRRLD